MKLGTQIAAPAVAVTFDPLPQQDTAVRAARAAARQDQQTQHQRGSTERARTVSARGVRSEIPGVGGYPVLLAETPCFGIDRFALDDGCRINRQFRHARNRSRSSVHNWPVQSLTSRAVSPRQSAASATTCSWARPSINRLVFQPRVSLAAFTRRRNSDLERSAFQPNAKGGGTWGSTKKALR